MGGDAAASMNALSLIGSAVCMCSEADAVKKIELLFDCFDLEKNGDMSVTTCEILLLTFARGAQKMTGVGSELAASDAEKFVAAGFKEAGKSMDGVLSKADFVAWVTKAVTPLTFEQALVTL